ncbi:hypothetical protein D3C85_1485020 [compost metagenome]
MLKRVSTIRSLNLEALKMAISLACKVGVSSSTMMVKTGGHEAVDSIKPQLATRVVLTAKYFMILVRKTTPKAMASRIQRATAASLWKLATKSLCNIVAWKTAVLSRLLARMSTLAVA